VAAKEQKTVGFCGKARGKYLKIKKKREERDSGEGESGRKEGMEGELRHGGEGALGFSCAH